MKVNVKRYFALLLVIAFIVSIMGGCSDKSEDNKTTDGSDVTEVSEQDKNIDEENNESSKEDIIISEGPIEPEELGSGNVKWSEEVKDGYVLVTNEEGAALSYSKESGLTLIQVDGFAFKDLNQNNMLDIHEDWRMGAEERAIALAEELPTEVIAGLMLHSSHLFAIGEELDEFQMNFIDTHGRAFLSAAQNAGVETTVNWNNLVQLRAESMPFSIPVSVSSDPRNSGIASVWPAELALAATFNTELVEEAGRIMSIEHRMWGIDTFLKPLVSIATDPRWYRFEASFGEDPALNRDMTKALVNGTQSTFSSEGEDLGWGEYSMNAVIKRWPGDGSSEGGRSSHSKQGEITVYPGGAEETHLIPYVDGGFKLDGKTEAATAVMLSYSISADDDEVGTAYSQYKTTDLLRDTYDFKGIALTDWMAARPTGTFPLSTAHGLEESTEAELIYAGIMAGTDQFGGNNDSSLVMEAYDMAVIDWGEEFIDERFKASAARILRNKFLVGQFENPYLDAEKSIEIVGNDAYRAAAFEAHQQSVIMLKNKDGVIQKKDGDEKPKVYVPMMFTPVIQGMFAPAPSKMGLPIPMETLSEYFDVVTDTLPETFSGPADKNGNPMPVATDVIRASTAEIAECDFVLAIIDAPVNEGSYLKGFGHDPETDTYIPLSLQYGPYTADSEYVRKESIGGRTTQVEKDGKYGTELVDVKENRSYFGQDANVTNSDQMLTVLSVAETAPEDMPVIVVLDADKPVVVAEFEGVADALLIEFGVNSKAVLDVVSGRFEPKGLLPAQMPKDMVAVEKQLEDIPRDMECYVDSEGNTYDFAFGMNWTGVIQDERVTKYSVPALIMPEN